MSQKSGPQGRAEQHVKDIRRATRKQYSSEEKIRIVMEGLEPALAREVAKQLMAHDALGTHARDELGISEVVTARPTQAALSSAATFSMGAALPLLAVIVAPLAIIAEVTTGVSLVALALLGALSAYTGGAPIMRAVLRVTFWGALAMAATALVGYTFGTTVA